MSLNNIMSSPRFNKSTYILAANRPIRRKYCHQPAEDDRERVDHTQDDNGITWTRKPEDSSTENGPKLFQYTDTLAGVKENDQGYFELSKDKQELLEPLAESTTVSVGPDGPTSEVWVQKVPHGSMLDKALHFNEKLVIAESCTGYKDDPRYFLLRTDGTDANTEISKKGDGIAISDNGEQDTTVVVESLTVRDLNADGGIERTVRAVPIAFTECLPTITHTGKQPASTRFGTETQWSNDPKTTNYRKIVKFIGKALDNLAETTVFKFCENGIEKSMKNVLGGDAFPKGWGHTKDGTPLFEVFMRNDNAKVHSDLLKDMIVDGLKSRAVRRLLSRGADLDNLVKLNRKSIGAPGDVIAKVEITMRWRPQALSNTYAGDVVPPTLKLASFTVILNPEAIELEPMFFTDEISGEPGQNGWAALGDNVDLAAATTNARAEAQNNAIANISNHYDPTEYRITSSLTVQWNDEIATAPDEDAAKSIEHVTKTSFKVYDKQTDLLVATMRMYHQVVDVSTPLVTQLAEEYTDLGKFDEFYEFLANEMKGAIAAKVEIAEKRVLWIKEGNAPTPSKVKEVFLQASNKGVLGTYHGPLNRDRVVITVDSKEGNAAGVNYMEHTYSVVLLAQSGIMKTYNSIVTIREVICKTLTLIFTDSTITADAITFNSDGTKFKSECTLKGNTVGKDFSVVAVPTITGENSDFVQTRGQLLFEEEEIYKFITCVSCNTTPGTDEDNGLLVDGDATTQYSAPLVDIKPEYKSISFVRDHVVDGAEYWTATVRVRDRDGTQSSRGITVIQMPQNLWWEAQPLQPQLLPGTELYNKRIGILSSSLREADAVFSTKDLGSFSTPFSIDIPNVDAKGKFPHLRMVSTFGPVDQLECCDKDQMNARMETDTVHISYTAERTPGSVSIDIPGENNPVDKFLASAVSTLKVEYKVQDDEDPIIASGVLGELLCTKVKECDGSSAIPDDIADSMIANETTLEDSDPKSLVRCVSDDLEKDVYSVVLRQSVWLGCGTNANTRCTRSKTWKVRGNGEFQEDAAAVGNSKGRVVVTTSVPPPTLNLPGMPGMVLYTSDEPIDIKEFTALADLDALLAKLRPVTATDVDENIVYAATTKLKTKTPLDASEIRARNGWKLFTTAGSVKNIHTLHGVKADGFICVAPAGIKVKDVSLIDDIFETYLQAEPRGWLDGNAKGLIEADGMEQVNTLHGVLQSFISLDSDDGKCLEAEANYQELLSHLKANSTPLAAAVLGSVYIAASALVVTDEAGNSATRTSFQVYYDTKKPSKTGLDADLVVTLAPTAAVLQKVLRAEAPNTYGDLVAARKKTFAVDQTEKKVDDTCEGPIDIVTAVYRKSDIRHTFMRGLYGAKTGKNEEVFLTHQNNGLNIPIPVAQDEKVCDMSISRYASDCVGNTAHEEEIVSIRDTKGIASSTLAAAEAADTGGFAKKSVLELDVLGGAFVMLGTNDGAVSLNEVAESIQVKVPPVTVNYISSELFSFERPDFEYYEHPRAWAVLSIHVPTAQLVDGIYSKYTDENKNDTIDQILSSTYSNYPDALKPGTIDKITIVSSLGFDLQGGEIYDALQTYDTNDDNVVVSYTDARNYELVWSVDDGGTKTVVVRHATRPIVLVDVEESTLGFDKAGCTNFPTKFECCDFITVKKATSWTEMTAIDEKLKENVKDVIEGVENPIHDKHYKVLHQRSRTITGEAAEKLVTNEIDITEEAAKLIANGDIATEADFKKKVAAVDITEYCICLSNVKECIYTEYTVSYDVTGIALHYETGTAGVNVIPVGKGGAGRLVTTSDLDLSTLVEGIGSMAPSTKELGVAATLAKGYYFDQEGNVFNLASSDPVVTADVTDVEEKLKGWMATSVTEDKEKWGTSGGRRLIEAVYVQWQAVDGFDNDVEDTKSNWQIWALMVEASDEQDEQDVLRVSDSIKGWDRGLLTSMKNGSKIKQEGDSHVLEVVVPLTLDLAESANAVVQWSAMGRSGTKNADFKTEMPFGPFEVTSFYEPALDIETDVVEDISPRTINKATTAVKKLVFSSEVGSNNGVFKDWRSRTVYSSREVSIKIAVDSVFKHWSWPYEDGTSKFYDLLKHLDEAADEKDDRVDSSRSLAYTIKGTKAYSSAAGSGNLILLEQGKGNGIAIVTGAEGESPLVDTGDGSLTTGVLYGGGADVGNAIINEGIGLVLEAVDSGSAMRLRGFAGSVKQSTYDSTRTYSAATNDGDVEIVYYKDRPFYATGGVGENTTPLDEDGTLGGNWANIVIKPASVSADGVVYMVEEFPDYYSIWRSDVRLDAVYDKQGGKLATLVKSGDAIDERVGFAPAHSHNPPAADSYSKDGAGAKVVMEGGDVKYKLTRAREVQDGDSRLSAMLDVDITMPDEVHVLGNSKETTAIGYVSGRSVDLTNDTTLSYDKDGKLQIVLKDDGEWLTVSRLVANGKHEEVQPANTILENDKLQVVYGDGFRVTVPFDKTQLATTVKFVVPRVDDTTATKALALAAATYANPDFADLAILALQPGTTTTTVAQWEAFVTAVKTRVDLAEPKQEYSLFKEGADVTGSTNLVALQSNAMDAAVDAAVGKIEGMEAVLDVYGERKGHLQVVVRVTMKLPDNIVLGDNNVLLSHLSAWSTETFKLDLLYSDVSQAIWDEPDPDKLTVKDDWDGKFQENVVINDAIQETKYGKGKLSDVSIELRPKDGGDAIRISNEVMHWLIEALYGSIDDGGVNPANNLAKQLAGAGKGSISLQVATASEETKSVDLGFKLTLVSNAYGRKDHKEIVLDACDVMTHPADAKLLKMTGAFDDSSSGEPQFTLDGVPVDVVKVGTEETNEEEGNNPYAVVYHDNSDGVGNEVNIVLLMPQHLALYDAKGKTAAESDLFDALTKK